MVHYVQTANDLDWIINTGPHHPYAVLLNASDFNMTTLSRLKSSGKVNGVMVIHIQDSNGYIQDAPVAFSPDTSCPNNQFGLYSGTEHDGCPDVKWNEPGDGMMFEDIGFPIFTLLDQKDVNTIINKCYNQYNKPDETGTPRDYPLCAVQLKDRMDGAKDSETCIRRTRHQMNLSPERYCDPLGDWNVYATIQNINNKQTRENRSVIIAGARLDSFSMFENIYPSADNHVSGIVALLAAAQVLGTPEVKEQLKAPGVTKDLMFAFFQGEAFDYIGSSRMVYDMKQRQFPYKFDTYLSPIELQHINSFIEVNQLAFRDNGKIWIHTDPLSKHDVSIKTEVDQMVASLKQLGPDLVDSVKEGQPLPPASVQSFLKEHNLSAVVLTDHQKGFTNKYYNSRFDLANSIRASYPVSLNKTEWYDYVTPQASNLSQVATLLARYLFHAVTGKNATMNLTADNTTVTHLLYCFLISPNCELFKEVTDGSQLSVNPYPFYVSVSHQFNEVTALTQRLMMYYMGERNDNITTKSSCKEKNSPAQQCMWLPGELFLPNNTRTPSCYCGNVNISQASSVAFDLDDYDYKSGKYPTWTESSWQTNAMDVRIFLVPSKQFETTTLVVGVVLLLLSLLVSYLLNQRADILFSQQPWRNFSQLESDSL